MFNTKSKFYLLLVLSGIVLLVAVLYADKQIRAQHVASEHELVDHSLSHLNNELIKQLYHNIQVVKSIPSLFVLNPSLSEQDFTTAVKSIIDEHPQLRNIAAAPDLVIKYMYPIEGNEAAIGLNYRDKADQLPSVLSAKRTRKLTLAGPVKLVQGGTGFISRIPVYLKNDDGNDVFWGIVSAVIDADTLHEEVKLNAAYLGVEVAIRGKDGLGAQGEVFFGNPDIFQDGHLDTIRLPNGAWQISARPRGGWTKAPKDIWKKRALLASVATGIFILFFSFINALMRAAFSNLKFKKFLEDNPIPYVLSNKRQHITFANKAFTQLFGYTLKDLSGERWWHSTYPDADYRAQVRAQWKDYLKRFQLSSEPIPPLEVKLCCKNGEYKTVLVSLSESSNKDFPVIFYDITERKQLEIAAKEKIEELAFYDSLTGLPNRRLLIDRLTHEIEVSVRSGHIGSLLFLDLDNFKTLNDTLGHDMGDILLQQTAERLKSCVRDGDTVARLGGDEFVILLTNLSENDELAAAETNMVANKVRTNLHQAFLLNNHEYIGSTSIGTTLFHPYSQSVDELLKQADIAMYQAKQDGRNLVRTFDPYMQAAITRRAAQEQALKEAITKQQLHLYYQVQMDAQQHAIGAEALIRWEHPKQGIVPPFDFIPLAEETGLIIDIGKWVLHAACKQLEQWQQNSLTKHLSLSINVSAKQFRESNFVSEVRSITDAYNIDISKLKMELTESLLLDNVDETIIKMNHLATTGIQFSLDDFGTGYSSLQYLKRLPLYQLKIDQSFVQDVTTDSSDQAIIRTIIAMANSLGVDVIAEGVETEEQEQRLFSKGCRQFQGYLYSKPVPIEAFHDLLATLQS